MRNQMSGSMLKNLLDMDLDLSQDGWRDSIPIAFIGQDGRPLLNAARFEDRLRDPVLETIEWPQEDDAVVAFTGGFKTLAQGRDNFAIDGRRNML